MGKPANNMKVCAYFKRKPNSLGDDIETDFEPPILFKGKRTTITKRVATIGGMFATATSTFFITYDLPLSSSEIKKDDFIVMDCHGLPLYVNQHIWRVNSATIDTEKLAVNPSSEEEAERKAEKRIEVD